MTLPLSELKVLDFSTLLPGPYATQILSDMGAQVLRVEAPNRPDLLRVMPPSLGKVSAAHATINRNKDCIAVDLKRPEAKEIIHRLLESYDIVIEQFRPGVMAKFGLDYESLKADYPHLIYCSITGYGQTGPYKDRAGHDINYLALSGLASYSGTQESGPVLSGTQIADIAGGSHHAVMAILAAVIERNQTGVGRYLDISMTDAALALTTMFGAGALASGEVPGLGKEMLNGGLFYGYYETKDGRYFSVGSLEPNFAMGMLQALELQDYAGKLMDQRPEAQAELRSMLAQKFVEHNFDYWQSVFAAIDVCIEPVLDLNEVQAHPLFSARQMFVDAEDVDGNKVKQIASPLPFKSSEIPIAGKQLGADTDQILQEIGYDETQISAMKASKVVKGTGS